MSAFFSPRFALLFLSTASTSFLALQFAGHNDVVFKAALASLIVAPLIRVLGGQESDGRLQVRHLGAGVCVAIFLIIASGSTRLFPAALLLTLVTGVWFAFAAFNRSMSADTPYKYLLALYLISFMFAAVYTILKYLAPDSFASAFNRPFLDRLVLAREWIGFVLLALTMVNLLWQAARNFVDRIKEIMPRQRGQTEDPDGNKVDASPFAAIGVIFDFLHSIVEFIFKVAMHAGAALAEAIVDYLRSFVRMRSAIFLAIRAILVVFATLVCIELFSLLAPGAEIYFAAAQASSELGHADLGQILFITFVPRIDIGWAALWNWLSVVVLFAAITLLFGLVYVMCARLDKALALVLSFQMTLTYFCYVSIIWLTATIFATGCAASIWLYDCSTTRHGSLWLTLAVIVVSGTILTPFSRKPKRILLSELTVTSGDGPAA
jgi:hypothetical protein